MSKTSITILLFEAEKSSLRRTFIKDSKRDATNGIKSVRLTDFIIIFKAVHPNSKFSVFKTLLIKSNVDGKKGENLTWHDLAIDDIGRTNWNGYLEAPVVNIRHIWSNLSSIWSLSL